jgi:HD-GYP domain-containing protein (c-di-GMP phosphodiesterase class II)/ligand-binding sensor protein
MILESQARNYPKLLREKSIFIPFLFSKERNLHNLLRAFYQKVETLKDLLLSQMCDKILQKMEKRNFTLEELLDLSWIAKLLDDYSQIVKMPLFILNEEGEFLIEPPFYTDYCALIRETQIGIGGCKENLKELYETCAQFKSSESIECHSKLYMVGTPIIVEGKVLGLIGGCQVLPYKLTERERRGYLKIGKRLRLWNPEDLATSIEKCRVISEAEKREVMERLASWGRIIAELALKEIEMINVKLGIATASELGELIESNLGVEPITSFILGKAMEILNATKGSILIRDGAKDFALVACKGLSDEDIAFLKSKILKRIGNDQKPLIINNVDEEFQNTTFNKLLSIPLKIRNKLLGVITLGNKASGESFTISDKALLSALVIEGSIFIENANLNRNIHNLFIDIIKAFITTIEAKDPYTRGHSERVTEISLAIAKEMSLPFNKLVGVKLSALFHDIGKIVIFDDILLKNGALTKKEFDRVKRHPIIGGRIIRNIQSLRKVLPGVVFHHERYDGGGYPKGLKGREIPLYGKIIAISDAFDAMTSDRPYRRKMSPEEAVQEIRVNSGRQFDPEVVKEFLKAYKKGKIK